MILCKRGKAEVRSARTAQVLNEHLGWAEIRHPFHPLRGQRFPVLMKTRRVAGTETLLLGHVERGSFSVAREWTDWGAPTVEDCCEVSACRLGEDTHLQGAGRRIRLSGLYVWAAVLCGDWAGLYWHAHEAVHLIADNYATHKHPAVQEWLAKHPRFNMHFTPTSASWLNMVERFFRDLTTERLRRGVFTSVPELVAAINEYVAHHNTDPKPFIWTKSARHLAEGHSRQ